MNNNSKNRVKNLNLSTIQQLVTNLNEGYIDNSLFISMNNSNYGNQILSIDQPYLLGEGRVMRIVSGKASAFINLEHQHLEPQMCFIIPPNSIFEIKQLSEDFKLQVFSFRELPNHIKLDHFSGFRLTDFEWEIADSYFNLIWQESQCKPINMYVIKQLQLAFLARLEEYYKTSETAVSMQKNSVQLQLFRQFLEIISQYGTQEHFISFYADKIGVSPNYLGTVVKAVSGSTCAELINRNLIMHAKIMLKYSDDPAWMISDALNFPNPSEFSKFFKREAGITPLSYRKS